MCRIVAARIGSALPMIFLGIGISGAVAGGSTCEEVYCRHVGKVKIFKSPTEHRIVEIERDIAVYNGAVLTVFADETVFLEAGQSEGKLQDLKGIAAPKQLDKTVSFDLKQLVDADGVSMMLEVENPFSLALRYDIHIYNPTNQKYVYTSSCPVQPGLSVYETWPYPILSMAIMNFRLLKLDDPKVNRCE